MVEATNFGRAERSQSGLKLDLLELATHWTELVILTGKFIEKHLPDGGSDWMYQLELDQRKFKLPDNLEYLYVLSGRY